MKKGSSNSLHLEQTFHPSPPLGLTMRDHAKTLSRCESTHCSTCRTMHTLKVLENQECCVWALALARNCTLWISGFLGASTKCHSMPNCNCPPGGVILAQRGHQSGAGDELCSVSHPRQLLRSSNHGPPPNPWDGQKWSSSFSQLLLHGKCLWRMIWGKCQDLSKTLPAKISIKSVSHLHQQFALFETHSKNFKDELESNGNVDFPLAGIVAKNRPPAKRQHRISLFKLLLWKCRFCSALWICPHSWVFPCSTEKCVCWFLRWTSRTRWWPDDAHIIKEDEDLPARQQPTLDRGESCNPHTNKKKKRVAWRVVLLPTFPCKKGLSHPPTNTSSHFRPTVSWAQPGSRMTRTLAKLRILRIVSVPTVTWNAGTSCPWNAGLLRDFEWTPTSHRIDGNCGWRFVSPRTQKEFQKLELEPKFFLTQIPLSLTKKNHFIHLWCTPLSMGTLSHSTYLQWSAPTQSSFAVFSMTSCVFALDLDDVGEKRRWRKRNSLDINQDGEHPQTFSHYFVDHDNAHRRRNNKFSTYDLRLHFGFNATNVLLHTITTAGCTLGATPEHMLWVPRWNEMKHCPSAWPFVTLLKTTWKNKHMPILDQQNPLTAQWPHCTCHAVLNNVECPEHRTTHFLPTTIPCEPRSWQHPPSLYHLNTKNLRMRFVAVE